MQVAREYREDVGSASYQQILHVLNKVNEKRTRLGEQPISFRQAVHAMSLQDSFTGKIKSGVYIPTLERLEALAKFLDVDPTVFDIYVKRFADKVILEGGLFNTFRFMASLKPMQQKVLGKAVDDFVHDVMQEYRRPHREPIAV